ncbi:hypothetical protein [Nocardia alni]|uniref:hypothetical protein n=1 Tax=Nocardia alni TaxID=2815723 RepID=UPI001C24DBBD|nr:hypothetical protein [Nocardia alni]
MDELTNSTAFESPAWGAWLDDMDTRLTHFATVTIPGLPEPFWGDPAIERICAVFPVFFPTEDTATDPARFETIDVFVRWIGECYIRRIEGFVWFSHPHAARGIYSGFGPALRHPGRDEDTMFVLEILEWAATESLGRVRRSLGW